MADGNKRGANNAIVSDEMAKKFASEKETPYTAWIRKEGLDIIDALYVRNLNTVELKPWARREGKGVYLTHDASRTTTIATSARSRRARNSPLSECSMKK